MTPQEMIDVIQAHADGKQIQMRPKEDVMWIDCKPPSPMFDFCHHEYRVKPAALRPHWPAIVHDTQLNMQLVETVLFVTAEEAREFYPDRLRVIRLATEYPPVMLP